MAGFGYAMILVIIAFLLHTFVLKKERQTSSQLLQIAVDYTKFFEDTKLKLERFLQETTFDELIANHVKPAVGKLASVRKQTEIYEKMDRTTGGPQNFMTTSLKILDEIQTQLYDWEKRYRLATFKLKTTWPSLIGLVDEVQTKVVFLHSDDFFEPLNKFQIHFQPMDFDDEERQLQNQLAITNPVPVKTILTHIEDKLLPLIRKFEDIKIAKNEPPVLDMDLEMVNMDNNIFNILTEMTPHIQSYAGHYHQLGVYWTKNLGELKAISNSAVGKAEKSKTKYEGIASGMDNDIANLKERIKNL